MIILEYKVSRIISYAILAFLIIMILNIPRSHNGSDVDGETGEESEGKPTDTPHSRND